ncbi:hypothetical protein A9X02_01815 [Mycobacterium malmoense]|nr:hypothetical protein A9X02_01815 [Mycobacterium malmoense]
MNADGDMRVTVLAKRDPPRVQIHAGPLRFTATEAEAVTLATQLADAVAELRAARVYRNDNTTAPKENR